MGTDKHPTMYTVFPYSELMYDGLWFINLLDNTSTQITCLFPLRLGESFVNSCSLFQY